MINNKQTMKKILLGAILIFSMMSCTQQSKLEKFVEKEVKNKLNDPESFELVSLKTEKTEVVNILFEKTKDEVKIRKSNYDKYGDNESASKYNLAKKTEDNVMQVNNGTMVYVSYTYRAKNLTGDTVTETKFSFIDLKKI
jgi:hypothetical protein